jgi:hypothetical protein
VHMRRTALALALATAVTVPSVSITTAAFARDRPAGTHPVSKPAKVAFTAAGTITAVDTAAGTVTVAAKGGTKDVRGKTVTVAVGSTTRIRVGGARKTLADLAVGYRVAVVGVRQDTTYTAGLIEASAAAKHTPTPSDDTTPEPSGSESRGS